MNRLLTAATHKGQKQPAQRPAEYDTGVHNAYSVLQQYLRQSQLKKQHRILLLRGITGDAEMCTRTESPWEDAEETAVQAAPGRTTESRA